MDLEKDRVYLPLDCWSARLSGRRAVRARRFDERFRAAMKEAVDVARELFLKGLPLAGSVDRRLAIDLELFSRGGLKVLEKIERQDYNVLRGAPGDLENRARGLAAGRAHAAGILASRMTRRGILRLVRRASRAAQAKNFYYSFLLLSRPQRQRHVRDLCVHALLRRSERRRRHRATVAAAIARWRADLECRSGRPRPRSPALAGVRRRRHALSKSRINISST